MPTTLTLTDLDVAYGARTLVRGLQLVIAAGDVVALVGPNGSGKSSLMRTIIGELPPEAGSLRVAPADATIGWLPQVPPDPAETLLGYARRRTGVAVADLALHQASADLASQSDEAADRYTSALEHWLALGAGDLEDRLPQVAAELGLDAGPDRPLGSLSGGQAARAVLATILLSRYDVLLLDEPTNNLDARGLALMSEFVTAHEGPVLVASHDRDFLDQVATRVVELDLPQQRIGYYSGGYSDFVEARELERRQAVEAFEEYAGTRDHLVAQSRQRADWAAQGTRNSALRDEQDKHIREKHQARADRQAAKSARLRRSADRLAKVAQPRKEWELRYALDSGSPSAEIVWLLDGFEIDRGGFHLGPIDLTVSRGDRLEIAGDNGSGKTTLLTGMLGGIPLSSGRITVGTRVRCGVIDQQRVLLETEATVLAVVRSELGDPEVAEVRTLLAKFGLGADHVERPARSLSMGERTRALMAIFQAQQVNVLVLDEPTNHLDVAAIEQLESALADYTGTIVVVSHDRAFLDRVGIERIVDLGTSRTP